MPPPRRDYELIFGTGPLGMTLQPHYRDDSDFPAVVVVKCISNLQAESFGAITEGDWVVAVQDRPVESFGEYAQLIRFIKEATRPLKVRFSSKHMNTPAERLRESLQARMDALDSALQRPEIQLDEIREFARAGLPDKYRAVVWKLLLGNLPLDRSKWDEYSAKQRELYETYVTDMFAPRVSKEKKEDARPARMEGQAWYEHFDDDGKSKAASVKSSKGKDIAKENDDEEGDDDVGKDYDEVEDILDEDVWKDVQRTHPGYHFFTQPTYVRMHRILYIYGKLNSGVSYVQGMNEILAPIMYVLGAYPGSDETTYEADSFFCFAALMSEVRDLFIRSLDGEKSGLHGQIQALESMIARHDPQVAKHMKQLDLHTQFFAVRWLTTMLTREFELPDALRLWDSMLSAPKRFHFILCCCTAMITTRHALILESDFPTCLKALQATCTVPVHIVLKEAERIRQKEIAFFKRKSWVPAVVAGNDGSARLEKVEGMALDLFRMAARAAKTVVEEAKLVVDEFKQPVPGKANPNTAVVTSSSSAVPGSPPPIRLEVREEEQEQESPRIQPLPLDLGTESAMAAVLGKKVLSETSGEETEKKAALDDNDEVEDNPLKAG